MSSPARLHRNIAIAIVVAGWAVAIPICLFSGEDEKPLPFELTYDSRININRLERLGGKSALFYQQLGEWLGSLWHGWRLGITIAVLSSAVALAWYLLAPRAIER